MMNNFTETFITIVKECVPRRQTADKQNHSFDKNCQDAVRFR